MRSILPSLGRFPIAVWRLLSTTRPEGRVVDASYAASLEIPDHGKWATDHLYFQDDWFESGLEFSGFEPTEEYAEGGFLGIRNITADIIDAPKSWLQRSQSPIGVIATARLHSEIELDDGTIESEVFEQKLKITGVSLSNGVMSLTLEDDLFSKLDQTYPPMKATTDNFPDIFEGHVGRVIEKVYGFGTKLQGSLTLVEPENDRWRYTIADSQDQSLSVQTVYRNNRIVAPSEYSTGNATETFQSWEDISIGSPSGADLSDPQQLTLVYESENSRSIARSTFRASHGEHRIILSGFNQPEMVVKVNGEEVSVFSATFTDKRFDVPVGGGTVEITLTATSGTSIMDGTVFGRTTRYIEFSQEPVDFNGNFYEITADVAEAINPFTDPIDSPSNPVAQIKNLLDAAGVQTDSASFSAAADQRVGTLYRVQGKYGRERTIRSLIEEHLIVARGALVPGPNGLRIILDVPRAPDLTYVEEEDPIEITNYSIDQSPRKVQVNYRPSIQTGDLELSTERHIGGLGDTVIFDLPNVFHFETADALADYISKGYTNTIQLELKHLTTDFETRFRLSSERYFDVPQSFVPTQLTRSVRGVEITAKQYNPDRYIYNPKGALAPTQTGYTPDFSNTPPAAPTNLTVNLPAAVLNEDNVAQSYAELTADIPPENAQYIQFIVRNEVTGELYGARGEVTSGATWAATVGGLRPNVDHSYRAFAVNRFGIEGQVVSSTSATGTFSETPERPAFITAVQGLGRFNEIRWGVVDGVVAGTTAKRYELQVSTNSGSTWANLDTAVGGTFYEHEGLSYGTNYRYRVRAVNIFNVPSDWRQMTTDVAVERNVTGSDMPDFTILNNNLGNGSITNIKISGFISSNDYSVGTDGWIIDKNGDAEFNNVTVRGTVAGSTITGSVFNLTSASGEEVDIGIGKGSTGALSLGNFASPTPNLTGISVFGYNTSLNANGLIKTTDSVEASVYVKVGVYSSIPAPGDFPQGALIVVDNDLFFKGSATGWNVVSK